MFKFGNLFYCLLDWVYPEGCVSCGARVKTWEGRYFCATCQGKINKVSAPVCRSCGVPFVSEQIGKLKGDFLCGRCRGGKHHFTMARSAGVYEGILRDMIHLYKFGGKELLRGMLLTLLMECADTFYSEKRIDVVTYVPVHYDRLKEREFDQSFLLAKGLSKKRGFAFAGNALVRHRDTVPQAGLPRRERRVNVKGAFAIQKQECIKGMNVLIVDDVMTTGETLDECAKVLKKGGASEVYAITVARTVLL